ANISARVVVSAVVGGTVSALTGGNFSDGAVAAAFQRLYNEESSRNQMREDLAKQFEVETGREPTEKELNQLEDKIYGAANKAYVEYVSGPNAEQNVRALPGMDPLDVEDYQTKFGVDLENIRLALLGDRVPYAIVNGTNNGIEATVTAPLPTHVNIFLKLIQLIFDIGPSTPLTEPQGGVQCSVANQGCDIVVLPPQ
ncbi:MAG: hypothetical protein ACREGG_04505, partial [Candidatus Saccharimonadales bacterium]